MPVVTTATGGLPVVDVSAFTPLRGTPVTEVANGRGVRVTKVAAYGMPVAYETIGVAAALIPATLNGTPTAATMSGGNLIATHNSAALGGVLSTSFKSSGKYYVEFTLLTSTSNLDAVGLIPSSANFGNWTNNGGLCVVLNMGSGNTAIYFDGVAGAGLIAAAVGNTYAMAADLGTKLFWARAIGAGGWNAGGAADPATGVGGYAVPNVPLTPGVRFINVSNSNAFRANFGASAFSGAVPVGFTAGWPA